jgi:hypothetical protein
MASFSFAQPKLCVHAPAQDSSIFMLEIQSDLKTRSTHISFGYPAYWTRWIWNPRCCLCATVAACLGNLHHPTGTPSSLLSYSLGPLAWWCFHYYLILACMDSCLILRLWSTLSRTEIKPYTSSSHRKPPLVPVILDQKDLESFTCISLKAGRLVGITHGWDSRYICAYEIN